MNNAYEIIKEDLIELLNNLDQFETTIEKFKQKHPQYEYNVKLSKQNSNWIASINIKSKNETDKIEVVKKIT